MPFAGTMGSASVFVVSEKPVHEFTGLATQGASPYTSWSSTTMSTGTFYSNYRQTRSIALNMTVSGSPATISYSFACRASGTGGSSATVTAYYYSSLNLTGTQTLIATLYAADSTFRDILSSGGSVSVPVGTKSCFLTVTLESTGSFDSYGYSLLTLS